MLSSSDVKKIEDKAQQQRNSYRLGEVSPIGSNIFNVIEKQYNCALLLYPIETQKVAGFTRKNDGIVQIFINSSFNRSFQIFAAAHELYHLMEISDNDTFILCEKDDISESYTDIRIDINELRANYFAAAFLLPEKVIKDRFVLKKYLSVNDNFILDILQIESEYSVPYKTIIKRIKELGIVNNVTFEKLLDYENEIPHYIKMLDVVTANTILELEKADFRKYHSWNVPKMSADNYIDYKITFPKLKSIINKYDKNIEDFGIKKVDIEPISLDFFKTGDENDETPTV